MLALLFALQGMYRAFNPPVRKQPEVRHALDNPDTAGGAGRVQPKL